MDAPAATPSLDRYAVVDRFGVAVPLVDPDSEREQQLLDDLIELQARESLIEARRARTIEQLRALTERRIAATAAARAASSRHDSADARGGATWTPRFTARRELATELATLLRESERTAETRIAHAELLGAQLTETADALERAAITPRHAQLIVDKACDLPAEVRGEFERRALAAAERLGVGPFARRLRRLRELMHPEPIEQRAEVASAERWVAVEPAADAMAYLTAYLPAVDAVAIHDRVSAIARDLAGEGETRTAAQRRADVFTALLVAGEVPGGTCETVGCSCGSSGRASAEDKHRAWPSKRCTPLGRGVRPRVSITVPALTLLARAGADVPADRRAAHLEGYGPIDDETAARWAARAPSFRRILTDPHTGAVLSVGRERYTVPADLSAALRVRDDTCRFPGCVRAASTCELDHTVDWAHGGATSADNLAHLCRSHHQLKHRTSWNVRHLGAGRLAWTSPRGRLHVTEPPGFADPPRVRNGAGEADHARPVPPRPPREDRSLRREPREDGSLRREPRDDGSLRREPRDDGSPPRRPRRRYGPSSPLPDEPPF